MIVTKDYTKKDHPLSEEIGLTASQKRRNRRRKLHATKTPKSDKKIDIVYIDFLKKGDFKNLDSNPKLSDVLKEHCLTTEIDILDIMSAKSRDQILAAREAKKIAKQGGKDIDNESIDPVKESPAKVTPSTELTTKTNLVPKPVKAKNIELPKKSESSSIDLTKTVKKAIDSTTKPEKNIHKPPSVSVKGTDEVDRATAKIVSTIGSDKLIVGEETSGEQQSKELIKAERAAKKAAKQAKKKGAAEGDGPPKKTEKDLTVQDVVETLNNIVNVAKEVQEVTAKVKAIDLEAIKPEEQTKSKAELKAERRAKQEAQRAAKAQQNPVAKPKAEPPVKVQGDSEKSKEEKAPKPKTIERVKKPLSSQRVYLFQHLYKEHNTDTLKKIAINSNLHPAIIKLGVQLASGVVIGSNARCIALLDALKKVVRDFRLPARAEVGRALEAALAGGVEWLRAARPLAAAQDNALNYFRRLLTQLPNNVDEFDAKKFLQEEIDRYIREQIDTAGEAISIAVRNKISPGDQILTYGCSSLVERILCEAWAARVQFRALVVGGGRRGAARELLRRLRARGLPCSYVDLTALSFVMPTVSKVVVGASALLANGSVLAAAGTAAVALCARAHNVAVLVACETHKFSDRVQTDAIVYNEIGDPDELIDKSDDNSPLKDWRSNPNLTPLNLVYDVTPPSLVTAVVTELAILPCTSAPVVLRFKLAEYGI